MKTPPRTTKNDIFLSNKPIIIDQADFNKNRTGCYMGASTFVSVTNCVFNASLFYEALPGDLYSGLYLDNCTGYQIEENSFYSNYVPAFPYGYISVGLVVNNSGPEDNLVYNNSFHNLRWATQAQGINRSKEGTGLTIKCNDYQNNYQDISVTASEQGDQNGIKAAQGSNGIEATAPAGNTFSHLNNNGNIYSDYLNNEFCGDIIYWHHYPFSTTQYVVPVYSTPTPHLLSTMSFNAPSYSKITSCPSTLTGHTKSTIIESISSNTISEEIYADSLYSLVDNGNTTSLILDVATSIPPETMLLRDQLLASSPYLSDTVMVSAAEKEDVLPNSIITEVLTANPQSATASNVLSTLDSRSNPLSDIEMASIHANDTIMGAKEILESKQAFYTSSMQYAVNGLIRKYMSDSMLVDINDSIKTSISLINSPDSYYKQAFCNYNSGDSSEVLNTLAQVPSNFGLTTYQNDMHNGYEDYFDLLLELQNEGKSTTEVDSTQKNMLYSIMQNTNEILQAYCRNVLIITDGLVYHEPYLFPDTVSTKSIPVKKPNFGNSFLKSSDFLRLYPNPADEYLTIEYKVPYNSHKIIVEILTIDGHNIEVLTLNREWGEKIIDLRNFKRGTYLIRLWADGSVIETRKFIKM